MQNIIAYGKNEKGKNNINFIDLKGMKSIIFRRIILYNNKNRRTTYSNFNKRV